jgi:hypothetical protein
MQKKQESLLHVPFLAAIFFDPEDGSEMLRQNVVAF